MPLTAKQIRFCEEYLKDLNATQAAIRAGYSKKTAYSIGSENLKRPEIKEHIENRLKECALSAEETMKYISDIARSSLNDYFTIREVYRTPQVTKTLRQIIKGLQQEILDTEEFIKRAGITNPDELTSFRSSNEARRREIIRLEIELERNPKATRLVGGEPELVKVAELDLPRLVADKDAGRIKSIKPTEFGVNVELYAADAALRDMARYHGLFEKDNKQKQPIINTTVEL